MSAYSSTISVDPSPLLGARGLDIHSPESAEERFFGRDTEPGSDQIARFGDDENRYHELERAVLEGGHRSVVVTIVRVGDRVQRSRIDDRHRHHDQRSRSRS
jgi:hypothetical protein